MLAVVVVQLIATEILLGHAEQYYYTPFCNRNQGCIQKNDKVTSILSILLTSAGSFWLVLSTISPYQEGRAMCTYHMPPKVEDF